MSNKPTILICIDWFAPGFQAGGPIKSAVNFCEALKNFYLIYVLTSNKDAGLESPYSDIEPNIWIGYKDDIHVMYLDKKHQSLSIIKNIISEINPNFIYLNSLFSIKFTILPILINKLLGHKWTIILAPRGMLHDGALKFKKNKKSFFLKLAHITGFYKKVVFQATDLQEQSDIKFYFSNNKVIIVPNINVAAQAPYVPIDKIAGALKIVFISRIVPKKNLLGLLKLIQKMDATIHLHLNIFGSIEHLSYFEACTAVIAKLPSRFEVKYCGPILPKNIDQTIKLHHVFILPTFGENYGHAIFEALLAGRPALISNQTPWQDLTVKNAGWAIPLEDQIKWLEILTMLGDMNTEQLEKYTNGAWQYASQYLKNNNLVKDYQNLFS